MALLGFEDAEVHDYLLGSLDNVSADSLVYVVLGCGLALGLLMRALARPAIDDDQRRIGAC